MQTLREVWWVRHGESVGNIGERTKEPGTYPLTPRGEDQAVAFAAWLDRTPSLIVTSPYRRAQQTAEPTLRRFPEARRDQWPIHEICYLAPARCVDTTQYERRAMARSFWEMLDPDFIDGPGAESFAQFIARAQDALTRLRALTAPCTVIFSHAVFMRGLLWLALANPPRIDRESMQLFHHFSLSFDVPNCGVLPMLVTESGAIHIGTIGDPTGAASAPANAEHIRLSGL